MLVTPPVEPFLAIGMSAEHLVDHRRKVIPLIAHGARVEGRRRVTVRRGLLFRRRSAGTRDRRFDVDRARRDSLSGVRRRRPYARVLLVSVSWLHRDRNSQREHRDARDQTQRQPPHVARAQQCFKTLS
jgi:hypothetical protein